MEETKHDSSSSGGDYWILVFQAAPDGENSVFLKSDHCDDSPNTCPWQVWFNKFIYLALSVFINDYRELQEKHSFFTIVPWKQHIPA